MPSAASLCCCFPWRSRRCPVSGHISHFPTVECTGHLLVWGITGWMYGAVQHHLLSLSKQRFGALTVVRSAARYVRRHHGGRHAGRLTLYALPAHYLPLFSLPLGAIAHLLR